MREEQFFEEESVDFDFLMSFVEEELRAATSAISATSSTSTTDDLIDRFLELKDLRIVVDEDVEPLADLDPLAPLDDEPSCDTVSKIDPLATEELAKIYINQGLYSEAKDIYTNLFLLYSEKITYFATQIGKLEEKCSQSR
ncbi:MAG: hypothetical protein R3Y16_07250 [Rikenellaceae bacterium]